MKGFVATPDFVVDLMVAKLFADNPPTAASVVLDPGCGRGAFIGGILRWCARRSTPVPRIIGIESDPIHAEIARAHFSNVLAVSIRNADFLAHSDQQYDYIIGNPPYVPITQLSAIERFAYRGAYRCAQGRFDLYLLFFEQALRVLRPGGRLVFITPEKYLYVETARHLRGILGQYHVDELHFLEERTFDHLVTYPLVTTIVAQAPGKTKVISRDDNHQHVHIFGRDASWLPIILGSSTEIGALCLGDICSRISCGVATGADSIFVVRNDHLSPALLQYARPTLAGRDLRQALSPSLGHSLLLPYNESGELIEEGSLGALGEYLSGESRRQRLLKRTCVSRKPWYAFHETPPLVDILKPKLLCKDITAAPFFMSDGQGSIVPRHSVYYIVPRSVHDLERLSSYLNSVEAAAWLRANCQRAANGFLRLQSAVLRKLPVPVEFQGARWTVETQKPALLA